MRFNIDLLVRYKNFEADSKIEAIEEIIKGIQEYEEPSSLVIGDIDAIEADKDVLQCPHCDAYVPLHDYGLDESMSHMAECPTLQKAKQN